MGAGRSRVSARAIQVGASCAFSPAPAASPAAQCLCTVPALPSPPTSAPLPAPDIFTSPTLNIITHAFSHAISALRKPHLSHPTTPHHVHMSHVQCTRALCMGHVSYLVRLFVHGSGGRVVAPYTFSRGISARNMHSGRLQSPPGPLVVGIPLRTCTMGFISANECILAFLKAEILMNSFIRFSDTKSLSFC